LLKQGWTDSLRYLFPHEQTFTFWDYFRNHVQTNSGHQASRLVGAALNYEALECIAAFERDIPQLATELV
jgi:exonuclease III